MHLDNQLSCKLQPRQDPRCNVRLLEHKVDQWKLGSSIELDVRAAGPRTRGTKPLWWCTLCLCLSSRAFCLSSSRPSLHAASSISLR